MPHSLKIACLGWLPLAAISTFAGPAPNAAKPSGEPVLEAPTLHSLGVHWIIAGDDNQNAVVQVAWRTRGGPWRDGAPLLRVERGAHKPEGNPGSVAVPADAWLFAGSNAGGTHDVWFEGLTIRRAQWAFVAHEAARIVVRHCHIHDTEYGITATRNDHDTLRGWFVTDNLIEGPSVWPRSIGIENARGVQISGEGHVIAYNRVRRFADAIDTFPSPRCCAIDIHNNEISECTDDGIELDYSERNVRCFHNRLTDVFQGISVQPIYGGPAYAFRNALYNVIQEPFKMHNSPSGALFFHNTCVKQGMPLVLQTSDRVRNCVSRNNLFIGTAARYAYETTAPMIDCDFDYDGFGGGPWEMFLKWNDQRYKTLDEVRSKAPAYRHAVLVTSGPAPPDDPAKKHEPADLRLPPGCSAIDAGEKLVGFNGDFAAGSPDLGAYELGEPLPHYGPRPHQPARPLIQPDF